MITIRLILAIASQYVDWGARVIDVVTAFLRAFMPECDEKDAVYVKPPALLEQFKLIKPGTFWKLIKALYGLRVSPRLWGKERDKRLRELRILLGNMMLKFFVKTIHHNIFPHVWMHFCLKLSCLN